MLAVAFGAAAWVLGPTPGGHAAAAIAGLELAVWALDRRAGLTKAVLPTDAPYWLDRAVTAGALRGRRRGARSPPIDRPDFRSSPAPACVERLDELVLVERADVAQTICSSASMISVIGNVAVFSAAVSSVSKSRYWS